MLGPDDVEYIAPGLRDATTASAGFFSSPEDLLQAAQQTNTYISSLADTVKRGGTWLRNVPKGNGAAIQAFFDQWTSYFASDFSNRLRVLAHWATGDLQGTLRNFQAQAADWGKKLKKWGADVAGPPTPGAEGGAKSVLMWVGIGAVAIGAIFLIGKLVHTATLGDARLEEAEGDAMKLLEERERKRQDKKTVYSIT